MSEFALIDLIRSHCKVKRDDVTTGIGDDAAVLQVPFEHELVVSIDTLVAGVHFPLDTKIEDIGWKALAVNLSDLAAMGATPAWASLALTLPSADTDWVARFITGFSELATSHKVALIGGDTTQGPFSTTIAIHGFVPIGQAILRSTAKPGDLIYVTGTLGDAAAGLTLIKKDKSLINCLLSNPLVQKLHRPVPRIAAGKILRGLATAAIDISDGLLADLGHICTQSKVGADIQINRLPSSDPLRRLFDFDSRINLQLSGGDDYELCFTVNKDKVETVEKLLKEQECPITRIGHITDGHGIKLLDEKGNEIKSFRKGWEHFMNNTKSGMG